MRVLELRHCRSRRKLRADDEGGRLEVASESDSGFSFELRASKAFRGYFYMKELKTGKHVSSSGALEESPCLALTEDWSDVASLWRHLLPEKVLQHAGGRFVSDDLVLTSAQEKAARFEFLDDGHTAVDVNRVKLVGRWEQVKARGNSQEKSKERKVGLQLRVGCCHKTFFGTLIRRETEEERAAEVKKWISEAAKRNKTDLTSKLTADSYGEKRSTKIDLDEDRSSSSLWQFQCSAEVLGSPALTLRSRRLRRRRTIKDVDEVVEFEADELKEEGESDSKEAKKTSYSMRTCLFVGIGAALLALVLLEWFD